MPCKKKMSLLLQTPTRRPGLARLTEDRSPHSPLTPLTPSFGTPASPCGDRPGHQGPAARDSEFDSNGALERGRAGLTGSSPAATRRAGAQRETARTNKKRVVSWFQKRFGRLSADVRSNGAIQQAKARKSSYAAV